MYAKKLKSLFAATLLLATATMFAGCTKDADPVDVDDPSDNPSGPSADEPSAQRSFGWNRESEDYSKYPKQISFGFSSSGNTANLPSKVDLTDKLPPVGDQGEYGTCITWSVGYGMRSYLNAVSKNLSKQQLADKSNQFSPADLWMAMDEKGDNCDGSFFEPAFDVLVRRGITTLQVAPYSSIQCEASPSQSWTSDASKYKILNYRMISEADMTVGNLKSHLAQGQLISFGARLGDNFMSWQGSGVLSSETYLQPDSQHANHAIILAGYDDSVGAKGAFLVYNSWGTEYWGDGKGMIWIDYDFFISNEFVFCAFVATPDNNVNPNDNNEIDPGNLTSGADLASYHAYDLPYTMQQGYNRQVYFNIYNTGTSPIISSNRWSVVYIYYNAYDANDFGVLTHLYFTDEVARGQIMPVPQNYVAYAVNKDIPSGKNVSAAVFDQPYEYLYMTYYLPPITGYYYMVVMADPFNTVPEANEQNNFFFIADANGYPYYIQNGMPMASSSTRSPDDDSIGTRAAAEKPLHSPVTEQNRNTYSPDEIRNMLMRHKQSGELEKKILEFDKTQAKPEIGGKPTPN
ncbi:MAG: C1 family peptidase [Tannerellaceae bacterium]|jgi:C1A family cysteine protease|nr:C1 family peptidase [Tannerellaceae bacterium]